MVGLCTSQNVTDQFWHFANQVMAGTQEWEEEFKANKTREAEEKARKKAEREERKRRKERGEEEVQIPLSPPDNEEDKSADGSGEEKKDEL